MAKDIQQRKLVFDEKILQKTLPHNLDAEKAVLGAIFLKSELFDDVIDFLMPYHFYSPQNRSVYEAMLSVKMKDHNIGEIAVMDYLRAQPNNTVFSDYLVELQDDLPIVKGIEQNARILVEKATLRSLIDASINIIQEAHTHETGPLTAITDRAESSILQAAEGHIIDHGKKLSTLVAQALNAFGGAAADNMGVKTWPQLDEMTTGLQPKTLTILAARPRMGKTACAISICAKAAEAGKNVAFFSMEMSDLEVAQRFLVAESTIPLHALRKGTIRSDEWTKVLNAADPITRWNITIDDYPSYTIMQLKSKARRMHRKTPLDLIVVDYLQLISHPGTHDRHLEVGEVSKGLKALAKELRIPVLALAQLNRQLEGRDDKRPILSDIRESGTIEQDADVILFLHRDHVYHSEADPFAAEIIVGKHRNGPTGTIRLEFNPELMTFK